MKIALAQINPTVGDFTGNLERIVAASRRAAALGARLTVFSELVICGYPPADFLEKPSFLARCRSAVDELAGATRDLPTAVLAAWPFRRRVRRANRGPQQQVLVAGVANRGPRQQALVAGVVNRP